MDNVSVTLGSYLACLRRHALLDRDLRGDPGEVLARLLVAAPEDALLLADALGHVSDALAEAARHEESAWIAQTEAAGPNTAGLERLSAQFDPASHQVLLAMPLYEAVLYLALRGINQAEINTALKSS
jgi:hypothetical protein